MRLRAVLPVVGIGAIVAAALIYEHAPFAQAQSSQALPAPASASCCGGADPAGLAPREIDFPYYSLKEGFHSTLMLVSDSPNPIDLTIGIRNLSGQMLTTTQTIQPQQKLAIDLASTIAKLGADPTGAFAEGSVAVYFMGTIMPVAGQMTVTNPALSLTHQVDMVENDPGRSDIPAVLNGAWWGLGGGNDAQVFVSNTSDTPEMAQVYLDFAGKRHALKKPLMFVPYETKVLDIAQLLASIGVSPDQVPAGGITIIQAGPHPALIASGKITDPATGFSSTIDFPDPAVQRASALHAVGLPIGKPTKDSPFAGGGYFVPHVVVRNLLGTPQTVTITAEYPVAAASGRRSLDVTTGAQRAPLQNDGASPPKRIIRRPPLPGDKDLHPEWGAGTGSTTGSTIVASFSVPAYSTTDYSLGPAMNELPLPLPFCSIRIQYSGAPGSMIADASSVEQASNMVVDAKAENERNGWDGSGANPWHVDKDTDSVLFLTNASSKPARIGLEVTANGMHYYLTELKLDPHETRAIDIRQLRDAQLADLKGGKIPGAATDGSINWNRLDSLPVMGRVMVINRRAGIADSYDCPTCPCPDKINGLELGPTAFYLLPSSIEYLTSTGVYVDCNNGDFYYDVTNGSSWSVDNTTVLQLDSSVPGRVEAFTRGTATVTGTYVDCAYYDTNPDLNCPCVETKEEQNSSQGTVQTPAFLLLKGDSCSGFTCPVGSGPSNVDQRFYQVLDESAAPIPIAGLTIAEQTSLTGDTCGLGPATDSGTWQTDANGIMTTPDYLWRCFPSGMSCYQTYTQSFTVNSYPVQVTTGVISGVTGSRNVIRFTASNGVGACPIVYPSP
ncbi:MAG: hypothetical protein KGM47_09340 [Acidobacteriota bacterium]|nr:hypothetical protein [Acidobacteriota bacterium]